MVTSDGILVIRKMSLHLCLTVTLSSVPDTANQCRRNDSVADQTSTAVQNFLNSLQGSASSGTRQERAFTTLPDLLSSSTTIPMIEEADPAFIEDLIVRHFPPSLVFLEHQVDDPDIEADEETLRASVQALSEHQQRDIVRRVLRSPQLDRKSVV